jgi:hypothetical protein
VYSPGHVPLALADAVHEAVTTTLSGVDPQLGNAAGLTVRDIVAGALDRVTSATGAMEGLHVNESGALPDVVLLAENLIMSGF